MRTQRTRRIVRLVLALVALPMLGIAVGQSPAGAEVEVPWVSVIEGPDGLDLVRTDGPPLWGADDRVLASEPEITVAALSTPVPRDPRRAEQWSLDAVPAEAAWADSDGSGVVIAILDTAVRADHEDLTGQLVTGVDLVDGDDDPSGDDHFHATHLAGIAVAAAGNGVGIHGTAPGARVMPVRVLDSLGLGTSSRVAEGILWAVEHGADIINLSLGSPAPSAVIDVAIDHARRAGVLVVAAAGNSGAYGNPTIYPAASPGVIAVGAIDEQQGRAAFSSHGPWLDLVAPGAGILSSHPNTTGHYAVANGSSMAAPMVAASAALVWSADPSLDADEVEAILVGTARDLGHPGPDPELGAGLIDPVAAVALALDPGSGVSTGGYHGVTSQGRVLAVGAVGAKAGITDRRLSHPVVGAASTPSSGGHWLVASDGGIFAFGDAPFWGSTGNITLNAPIVGMAPTPTGDGYWLVASDGGIFAFGDAQFWGSTGNITLNAPIVGMAPTPTGDGYWLVASDGGIFAFGDAGFVGSGANTDLGDPVRAVVPTSGGYRIVSETGAVMAFGEARWAGDIEGLDPHEQVVTLIE